MNYNSVFLGWFGSQFVRLSRLVFLPVRRVLSSDGRGSDSGRLKPLQSFLSLLHVKVQESPPVLMFFHFGPCTPNFVYGPDFCYINFDLVRLGLSIEINSMSMFYFGPHSFNFRIDLNNSINSVQQFHFFFNFVL